MISTLKGMSYAINGEKSTRHIASITRDFVDDDTFLQDDSKHVNDVSKL